MLAYDRRGYGRSAHRPVRDYRVQVADLAAVLAAVGSPAHVLGWSSGGTTALALAVARPELFRSLVIVEAPWHGLRHATPDLLAALGRAKVAQVRGRRDEAAAVLLRWASGLRDGGNGFDALAPAARAELLGNRAPVLAECRDWYGRLHARVAAAVPGLRTERIAGAGHLAHLDAPREFAAAVLGAVRS